MPGFDALGSTPVEAPQVSVMPQTSSMGTPSARYHAPDPARSAPRRSPGKARAVNADQLAHVVQRQPAAPAEQELQRPVRPAARQHAFGDLPMHADGPGVGPLLQRAAAFRAIIIDAGIELLPHPRHGEVNTVGAISRTFSGTVSGFSTKFSQPRCTARKYSPPMRSAMWHSGRESHALVAFARAISVL